MTLGGLAVGYRGIHARDHVAGTIAQSRSFLSQESEATPAHPGAPVTIWESSGSDAKAKAVPQFGSSGVLEIPPPTAAIDESEGLTPVFAPHTATAD